MKYKKLTKKTMPPVNNRHSFILWLGAKDTDGGFPLIAKRVEYDGKPPYIRYAKPFAGWIVLDESDYKDCIWAEIEIPVQVKSKYLKSMERFGEDASGDPHTERARQEIRRSVHA